MHFASIFSVTLALGLTSAKPVHVEKRQTIVSGLAAWASYELKDLLNGNQVTCDSVSWSDNNYWFAYGEGANGQYWQACWSNTSDTTPFGQTEADVADCLTNLHYTQADTCIGVGGSACDLDGYKENGGRLQNMRVLLGGSGTQSAAQLSADESSTIQGGWNFLVGQLVDGLNGNGPYVFATTSATGDVSDLTSDAAQMQVNWIGETAC